MSFVTSQPAWKPFMALCEAYTNVGQLVNRLSSSLSPENSIPMHLNCKCNYTW